MIDLSQTFWGLVQGICLLILAPGLLGLLQWAKAGLQGRRRSLRNTAQPYRDLGRLLDQPSVRTSTGDPASPEKTSWVFAAGPIILWSCYGTLAFAVPLFGQPPLLQIDLITFVYLLAFARFAFALAAMDGRAPLGGLGGNRSMFLNLPTELAMLSIMAALSLRWHTVSLCELVAYQQGLGWRYFLQADLILVALAFSIAIALEADRLPIDNPATWHALVMGRKAIKLEYAGSDLALVEWAESIKLGILLTLFVALFVVPVASSLVSDLPLVAIALANLAALTCVILLLAWSEAKRPKLRLRRVVQPAILAAGLSLLAILYSVVTHLGENP
jgi:formate hydrogenlyase subunit 4